MLCFELLQKINNARCFHHHYSLPLLLPIVCLLYKGPIVSSLAHLTFPFLSFILFTFYYKNGFSIKLTLNVIQFSPLMLSEFCPRIILLLLHYIWWVQYHY